MTLLEPTFRKCKSGTPLVPQNIQTDATVGVDVGVVNAGGEVNLGWLEGVVGREVNLQEEDTARVRRVGLSFTVRDCPTQVVECMMLELDRRPKSGSLLRSTRRV